MTPELVRIDPFTVAGLTVRTSNASEARPATAKIADLWAQFYREAVAERVSRSADARPYGVYWGYEAETSGLYNVTAGVALTTTRLLATDITAVEIQECDYLVFREKGTLPQLVWETWAQIWAYFAAPGQFRRAFTTDFERYDAPDAIAIHIAVRLERGREGDLAVRPPTR